MSAARRVVITGMGLVSPLGNSKEKFWSALTNGESGVKALTQFSPGELPLSFGGEAHEFTGHISEFGQLETSQKKAIRKSLKVMCREIQMGVAASQLALQDAELALDGIDRERTGVVFGSDYIMTNPFEFESGVRGCVQAESGFDFDSWAEQGLPKVTPLWLLKYLPNMPACHVAIFNDLRGPNNSLTVREASANLAIAEAYCTIERGHADAIISGATGTRIHPIKTVHVMLQEEVAEAGDDPSTLCRPFDADRTGVVVGEGAGALVLEELEHAEKRGASPIAEVVGFGSSTVIDKASIAHRDTAVANAIRQALRNAEMNPEEVGHINAHGLSSVRGDREEAAGIKAVFGEHKIPVVAPKSATGNMGAGSGAAELIASAMALREGHLFPTQNYETPDPQCPLPMVVSADAPAGKNALNVSVTSQGQASAIIVQGM